MQKKIQDASGWVMCSHRILYDKWLKVDIAKEKSITVISNYIILNILAESFCLGVSVYADTVLELVHTVNHWSITRRLSKNTQIQGEFIKCITRWPYVWFYVVWYNNIQSFNHRFKKKKNLKEYRHFKKWLWYFIIQKKTQNTHDQLIYWLNSKEIMIHCLSVGPVGQD